MMRSASLSAKPAIVEPKVSPKSGLSDTSHRERPSGFAESLREADRTLDQKPADRSQHDGSSTKQSAIDDGADRSEAATSGAKSRTDESAHDNEGQTTDSGIATVDPKSPPSEPVVVEDESAAELHGESDVAVANVPAAATGIASTSALMAKPDAQTVSPITVLPETSSNSDTVARPQSTVTPNVTNLVAQIAAVAPSTESATAVAAPVNPGELEANAGTAAPSNNTSAEESATPSVARPPFAVTPANNAQPDQRAPESGVVNQTAAADSNVNPVASPPVTEVTATQQPTRPRGRTDQSPADRPITPTESGSSSTPATARALQVEAGVRLENATGQVASPSAQATINGIQGQQPTTIAPQPNHTASTSAQFATPFGAPESDQNTDAPFAHRIVRGLSTMVNQRGGVMSMRLDPPELGALRVQMTLNQGVVTAEFQASSTQAHAMLERSMNTLRSALEGQGLTVERLVAHAPATGSASFSRDDGGQTNQHSSRQQHDAAGGESRGRRDAESQQSSTPYRNAMFSSLFEDSASHELRDLLAAV